MGRPSERHYHTKIKDGYCVICGEFGRLSQDHVPPKGAITITKVEQKHIMEAMGANANSIDGVRSPNGSKFKTICKKCNNERLGANDGEVARVHKELTAKIKTYFDTLASPYPIISVHLDSLKYVRAMIGHILAATSVDECKQPLQESPYFRPLEMFVLGDDGALDDTHDIYYWFYPHNRHLSAKYVQMYNKGHSTGLSLLSFFPIAFLVTPKGQGIYPAQANKLKIGDDRLYLNLSSVNVEFAEFPFSTLRGDQFRMCASKQTIISYPIKNT
ncbi:metal-binding protein [Photobacterium angustum]|uniref:hypothetical protein n=1 Tax=Photobacterium angustum TaxID=661 RepID=UPI0005DFB04B|nr:hypothetical protein [Photobacterium angustum]KJF93398.1 metal-binding protein [Photobacterium angustum]KJG07178.1 metal-binding protein [Photobacterium angustum]PSV90395.1 metal-binding protein [Photobacterium angustum]PSW83196.1 metal-binding protein [Photobacterium angustum]